MGEPNLTIKQANRIDGALSIVYNFQKSETHSVLDFRPQCPLSSYSFLCAELCMEQTAPYAVIRIFNLVLHLSCTLKICLQINLRTLLKFAFDLSLYLTRRRYRPVGVVHHKKKALNKVYQVHVHQ